MAFCIHCPYDAIKMIVLAVKTCDISTNRICELQNVVKFCPQNRILIVLSVQQCLYVSGSSHTVHYFWLYCILIFDSIVLTLGMVKIDWYDLIWLAWANIMSHIKYDKFGLFRTACTYCCSRDCIRITCMRGVSSDSDTHHNTS